jgi:magnesium-transporting ATPase (P-type)
METRAGLRAASRSSGDDAALAEDKAAEFVVATKGAPEAVALLCRLGEADMSAVHKAVDEMAAGGLRVLGVAKALHIKASPFRIPSTHSVSNHFQSHPYRLPGNGYRSGVFARL